MKQAILITAYKNFEHLKKLIDFFDDDFRIYIHIDTKSTINGSQMSELAQIENVELIEKKYRIQWGGINHLLSILYLCEEAIKDNTLEYFHLITGHDFPIKRLDQLKQYINNNKGSEFLTAFKLPNQNWKGGGLNRISFYHLHDIIDMRKRYNQILNRIFITVQKILRVHRNYLINHFSAIYGGGTYWSLSNEAVKYVIKYTKQHPELLKHFRMCYCPEELLFQSILMNSYLANKIADTNLRYIVWEKRNGNLPANLDESDLKNIMLSKALFARKFEYPVSQDLVLSLQKNLIEKRDS